MGVKDDILMVLDARAVADSLKEADLDTLVDLDEVLSKTTSDKIGQLMLQVIFELLPRRPASCWRPRPRRTSRRTTSSACLPGGQSARTDKAGPKGRDHNRWLTIGGCAASMDY
jgi:hypothetical protein